MPGKDAPTAVKISQLQKASGLAAGEQLYVNFLDDTVDRHSDPIEQLQKNIDHLRALTGELSFMVKEIGKLTSK